MGGVVAGVLGDCGVERLEGRADETIMGAVDQTVEQGHGNIALAAAEREQKLLVELASSHANHNPARIFRRFTYDALACRCLLARCNRRYMSLCYSIFQSVKRHLA
ncbi:hypothetical protein LRC39_23895 [Rhodopseudomonas sp. P1]|uniref:hypothetical protein n=1 Tax=Rhodopseudomonas sp. P1 TaxID=3434357 RepID=UPI0031FCA375